MVGLEILLRIEADKRHEFIQMRNLLARPDQRASQCLAHYLFEKVDEPNTYLWVEHWAETGPLEAWLETDRFRTLMGAIETLGELEGLHLIDFRAVDDRGG